MSVLLGWLVHMFFMESLKGPEGPCTHLIVHWLVVRECDQSRISLPVGKGMSVLEPVTWRRPRGRAIHTVFLCVGVGVGVG